MTNKIITIIIFQFCYFQIFAQRDQSFRTFKGHKAEVSAVALSGNGKTLVSASADFTIKFWKMSAKEDTAYRTSKGHTDLINTLDIRYEGDLVASGSEDKTLRLWMGATGKNISTYKILQTQPTKNKTSKKQNSKYKSIYKKNKPKTTSKNIKIPSSIYPSSVKSLCFNETGREVVTGHADNTIRIWQIGTDKMIKTIKGHIWSVISLDVSHDGKYIISTSGDSIKKWDYRTGRLIRTFGNHVGAINKIIYSPTGKFIVSAGDDRKLIIWKSLNCEQQSQIETGIIANAISISPDEKYLAIGGNDKKIQIWNIALRKHIHTFTGHRGSINSLCFTPDGSYLISGSSDRTIKVWYIGDMIINMLYAKQIENEMENSPKLSPVQGEFEKRTQFLQRCDSIAIYKRMIFDKYKRIHYEKIYKDSIINVAKIKKSYQKVNLRIDYISRYNAEDEYFMMNIAGQTSKVNIPIGDAESFKKNYTKAKVSGYKQLKLEAKTYEIFNIIIMHPVKKDKQYNFGKQRKPLYVNEK